MEEIEALTWVVIWYEIYETSLGNFGILRAFASKTPKLPNEFHKFDYYMITNVRFCLSHGPSDNKKCTKYIKVTAFHC